MKLVAALPAGVAAPAGVALMVFGISGASLAVLAAGDVGSGLPRSAAGSRCSSPAGR